MTGSQKIESEWIRIQEKHCVQLHYELEIFVLSYLPD